jgi:Chaperone of endosialidase
MSENRKIDDALAGVDEAKRATLTRLIAGSAFAAPVLASFAIDALTISSAQACVSNCTVGASGILVSDRRLKTGIRPVAALASGLGLYRFKYLWGDVEYVGVMAEEVLDVMPDAVVKGADGFLRVDYRMLGLEMETYAAWQSATATSPDLIGAG